MNRITVACRGFQIPGSPAIRLANMCVAFVWKKNTANYLAWVGRPPNYVRPRSRSEKMQWRKIFDHNPLFAIFADKIEARRYAEGIAADLHFTRFLWTGTEPETIPFDSLTQPYVIKPNSGSGDIIIVTDPAALDRGEAIGLCNHWLARKPYGRKKGEWGYRHVPQKIIIEEFLPGSGDFQSAPNYKFFVVSGKVRYIQVESKRNAQSYLTFFTREGTRWPVRKWIGRLKSEQRLTPDPTVGLPRQFPEMIQIAETLGANIDDVRVDLYCVEDKIYFSELTPYDGSGNSYFYHENEQFEIRPSHNLDLELGAAWVQPSIPFWKKVWALLTG